MTDADGTLPTGDRQQRTKRRRAGLEAGRGSLGKVARTSVMWGYLRTGVFALVGIPTTIILARLLTPYEFGVAAAATFFGQLAGRLSNGGFGAALIRLKVLRPDHVSSVFVLNMVAGVLGFVALNLAAPSIARFYAAPEIATALRVVSFDFVIGSMSVVQQALLSRDLRYREMATAGSLDITVAGVVSCTLAYMGLGYLSLPIADVCGSMAKWTWAVRVVGWHTSLKFSRAAIREMASFGLGSYAKRGLEHFTLNVDNLVIGRVLGVTALGFYDKAFSSVNKVLSKTTVVGPSVALRVFAIIQDEPARFQQAYRKMITTVTLVGYPLFALLGVCAPHVVWLAFGSRWEPSTVPFQVLCLTAMLKLVTQFGGSAALARGWVWSQVTRQCLQVIAVVVGVYLGSPWGITGAAYGVLGAAILYFVLMEQLMRAATGLTVRELLQPQLPAVLCALGVVALGWGIDRAFLSYAPSGFRIVVLLSQVTVCGLFVLAFLWRCPFPEVRVVLNDILGDVSPTWAQRLFPVGVAPVADATRGRA